MNWLAPRRRSAAARPSGRTRGLLALLALAVPLVVAGRMVVEWTKGEDFGVFTTHTQLRGLALLAAVRQRPPATILFGDSLVEGSTVDRLCGEPALAAGAWGARLADIALIAPAIVAAAKPKRVVVAIGVNDARRAAPTDPDTFASAYRSLIEPWIAAGIDVRLATLSPVVSGRPLGDGNFDPAAMARLDRAITALATELKRPLVDFGRMPHGADGGLDPTLSEDGVHPTPEGYRAWGAILEADACAPRRSDAAAAPQPAFFSISSRAEQTAS